MSGAGIEVSISGMELLAARVRSLSNARIDELLDVIGAEVESQTRRRISEERKSPAGVDWAPWSEPYKKTRHGGHTLLIGESDLLDSITRVVGIGDVEVGSNLVYAAMQQFGGAGASPPRPGHPAREFLGLSTENERELMQVIEDWWTGLLEGT